MNPLLIIAMAMTAHQQGYLAVDHGAIIAQVENRDGSITELDMGGHTHAVHKGGDIIAAWNGVYHHVRWTIFRVA